MDYERIAIKGVVTVLMFAVAIIIIYAGKPTIPNLQYWFGGFLIIAGTLFFWKG